METTHYPFNIWQTESLPKSCFFVLFFVFSPNIFHYTAQWHSIIQNMYIEKLSYFLTSIVQKPRFTYWSDFLLVARPNNIGTDENPHRSFVSLLLLGPINCGIVTSCRRILWHLIPCFVPQKHFVYTSVGDHHKWSHPKSAWICIISRGILEVIFLNDICNWITTWANKSISVSEIAWRRALN